MAKKLSLILIVFFIGLCFSGCENVKEKKNTILIKNVELLDSEKGEMYNIGIQDHKIVFVDKTIPNEFSSANVIDGKGMLATPGMVNTHNHVAMTMLRCYADDLNLDDWLNNYIWPIEAKMTPEDMYWGAMLGITEMLKSGTTCFSDMYFNEEQTIKAANTLGIRVNVGECLMSTRPTVAQDLERSVELFNNWNGYDDNRVRVVLMPHAPYTCDDDFLKEISKVAKENGIEIQMHLCETKAEVEDSLSEYGMTPIERMEKLGLLSCGVIASHAVHLSENDMNIMAKYNVRISTNPQSNLKLASGIADVPGLKEHGIMIGIGTDGASSNNNLDMLEEIRLEAMLHNGNTYNPHALSAKDAWEMGTSIGAKVIGFENLGELKEGQYADIVLWNMEKPYWYPHINKLSGLVYAANSSDVDTVLVNGKVVVFNGKLTTFNEEEIYKKVDECVNELFKSQRK